MNELDPVSTSLCNPEPYIPDENQQKRVLITRIRATDVAVGLRRLPSGFYVAVEIEGKTTETSNRPAVVGEDMMEWDEEIVLPLERISAISFRVYASFELGPRLGNGELLGEFMISVGHVLDCMEQAQSIDFLAQRDNEMLPSCFSLRITTEWRLWDVNEPMANHEVPNSDETDQIGQLTDAGHRALSCFRQRLNQRDLDEAITQFERVLDMCPPSHPDRSAVLFNLATARFIFCQTNAIFTLDNPITLYRESLDLRPVNHPDHCATALDLGFALLVRYHRSSDEADKVGAKDLFSRVVQLSPEKGYVYRAACLALSMAEAPSTRTVMAGMFRTADGEVDRDGLIKRGRAMLQNTSATDIRDPRRALLLAAQGMQLYLRFDRDGDINDIHEAISVLEEAVQVTSDDHPDKPDYLDYLRDSLFCRFEHLGDVHDLNKSIVMGEDAARLTPVSHPNKVARLTSTAKSLFSRSRGYGNIEDVNRCVSITEEAVHLVPNDHPDKPDLLCNHGNALYLRFQHLTNLADLTRSTSVFEEAINLASDDNPDKPFWLHRLGRLLARRFEHLGNVADMDKSVSIFKNALRLAVHDRSDLLRDLGTSLFHRFERFGSLEDIHESILVVAEAVRLNPNDDTATPGLLHALGVSLSRRFERLGNLEDVDQSISVFEDALCLTPEGHPQRPAVLSSLGASLFRRFERLRNPADINTSISVIEDAARLTPDDHPSKPGLLSNVGTSFLLRFELLGNLKDVDEAIRVEEKGVYLAPDDHPDKPSWLNNLGNSLCCRFERLGSTTDIDKSIAMHEEALRLTPDDHPNKSIRLNNIGGALHRRFQRLGDLADIRKSVSMVEEGLSLIADGHPNKPALLDNLGTMLTILFQQSGDPSTLSVAMSLFSAAARSTGPISIRFRACHGWIRAARLGDNSPLLLDAYAAIINLLPELAWLGLPLEQRHRLLLNAAHVARDAAAAAVGAGCPEMAVEWLEQGRSVVWSQFFQLRTPVDELRLEHSDLADRFHHISRELEQVSSRENPTSGRSAIDSGSVALLAEKETQRHHELATSRGKLIAEIRSVPGFDRFLLPKTIQQLVTSVPHLGPVVYLNASEQRCDALIVRADLGDVLYVPLADLSYQVVEFIQQLLHLLLERNHLILSREDIAALLPTEEGLRSQDLPRMLLMGGDTESSNRAVKPKPQRVEGYEPSELFSLILAELWKKAVKPVLDALDFSTPSSDGEKIPRIFWCPTGPFAFLPIHAAGLYHSSKPGLKLSDFAISSYTPTLNALATSPQKSTSSASNIRLLVIPQPPTDGLTRLPLVKKEIDHIQTLSTDSPFVTFHDSHGTVEDVLAKMSGSESDWVHFACHGVQDPDNPLDSGLCLADHRRLKLSDIIQLSRPRGGLAFLSACQTAQGDENLSEESVHLAAGMLLAGYNGVIATMWSIMDPDAPKVTKDVYGYLFKEGKVPDSTEAAEALHYAVRHLRDSGASFFSWVPFIHLGM